MIFDIALADDARPVMVSKKYVQEIVESLDVSAQGGVGQYIQSISQQDGKISVTAANVATSVEQGGVAPVAAGAVYTHVNNLLAGMISVTVGNDGTTFRSASIGAPPRECWSVGVVCAIGVQFDSGTATFKFGWQVIPVN